MTVTFPIYAKLGGKKRAHEMLVKNGIYSGVLSNLYNWEARGRLPGHAVLGIMRLCEMEGIECSLTDFEIPKDTTQPKTVVDYWKVWVESSKELSTKR